MDYIQSFVDQHIGYLCIDRPNKHNAFNAELIAEIKQALIQLENTPDASVIIIRSTGKNFCAGADIDYMRSMAAFSSQENLDDAMQLADLFWQIYHSKKPTIALVNGWVLGGGIGIVSCCDFAIAATNSEFCFSEVKLGLVPATISPFVVNKIGANKANQLFISADTFNAESALEMNLVSEIVTLGELEQRGAELAKHIMQHAPSALQASKQLIRELAPIKRDTIEYTSHMIAEIRAGGEAQEGLSAFLEKRTPSWKQH